jgi:hypothetical protein
MNAPDVWLHPSRERYASAELVTGAESAVSCRCGAPAGSSAYPCVDQPLDMGRQVAEIVSGIPSVGKACSALKKAGLGATIAGNRISVDGEVFVQYIGSGLGSVGRRGPAWVVYASAGEPVLTTAIGSQQ